MTLPYGCQSDAAPEVKEARDTCQKVKFLSDAVGCNGSQECEVEATCRAAADALLDCIADDISQCMCEQDGDLNCEGATKPSEGAAKCQQEGRVLAECQDDD